MRYAVLNTKGGVGKTTLAVHLAVMLAHEGPTVLFDGDAQQSAAAWAAWRRESVYNANPGPTTTCLGGKAILTEGKQIAAGFMHTVVDVGGSDAAALRSALLLAERALVPVGASNLDAAAMTDLLQVVDLAKDYNPSLDVRVVLSRVDPRTQRDAGGMLEFLAEHKLKVLDARISERVAFRRSIGEGSTAQEMKKDPAATQEMTALFQELHG